jgi:hypothetical protein
MASRINETLSVLGCWLRAVAAQQKGIRNLVSGQPPRSGRGEGHLNIWVEDPAAGGRSVALI